MTDKDKNTTVPADETGGTTPPEEKTPPTGGEENQGGNNEGGKNDMIPSYRLREETQKRKDAESRLAEYEKKEQEALEKKKQQEEEDLKKKGEHEKIISQKDEEISSYKAKEQEWDEKTKTIQAMADKKLESFKENNGTEALEKLKKVIDSDNPWTILNKFDDVVSLLGIDNKPSGGRLLPKGGDDRSLLKVYEEKLDNGERLSAEEEKKYIELLSKAE